MPQDRKAYLGVLLVQPHLLAQPHDGQVGVVARTLPEGPRETALRNLTDSRRRFHLRDQRLMALGAGWYMIISGKSADFVFAPPHGITAELAREVIATSGCRYTQKLPWPDQTAEIRAIGAFHDAVWRHWYAGRH